MPQSDMNERPRVFHEAPLPTVHDARMTGASGRPVVSWAITMGLGGLFLGFIGATDSYQYALPLRLAFWLGLCLVAGLIAITIERAVAGFGLRSRRFLVWWAVLTAALAIAMVPVIFLVNATGSRSPIADLPVFTLNSFAISAALVALRLVVGALLSPSSESQELALGPGRDPSPDDPRPRILTRLNPGLQSARLLALKSEGHYLQVITDQGSELILMRLKDAIEEVQPLEGMQVHRSWWLARQSGLEQRTNDSRIEIRLDEETWVPVSRTFRAAWREADW